MNLGLNVPSHAVIFSHLGKRPDVVGNRYVEFVNRLAGDHSWSVDLTKRVFILVAVMVRLRDGRFFANQMNFNFFYLKRFWRFDGQHGKCGFTSGQCVAINGKVELYVLAKCFVPK